MSYDLCMSNNAVNVMAAALAPRFNNGYRRIYAATRAANADTAVGAQTLLAELRFAATAMSGSPSNGVITFAAVTGDSSANASGTAAWFRDFESDGTTVIGDGECGATGSGSDLELSSLAIVATAPVSITSLTHTVRKRAT